MIRIPMSPAGAALFRALVARADVPRDQVLVTAIQSVDWQSLTMAGERHEIEIKLVGPYPAIAADALCDGLEDAEFSIPGQIVADICLAAPARVNSDGTVELSLQALTIAE